MDRRRLKETPQGHPLTGPNSEFRVEFDAEVILRRTVFSVIRNPHGFTLQNRSAGRIRLKRPDGEDLSVRGIHPRKNDPQHRPGDFNPVILGGIFEPSHDSVTRSSDARSSACIKRDATPLEME